MLLKELLEHTRVTEIVQLWVVHETGEPKADGMWKVEDVPEKYKDMIVGYITTEILYKDEVENNKGYDAPMLSVSLLDSREWNIE